MKSVFIIRLPLTYLNALEAQRYFKISVENSILVILYRDHQDIDCKHINKLLDKSLWKEVHLLPYNVPSLYSREDDTHRSIFHKLVLKHQKIKDFIRLQREFVENYQQIDKVFIGDYNIVSMRNLVHNLKPLEVVNLDEGLKVRAIFAEKADKMAKNKIKVDIRQYLKEFFAYQIYHYNMQDIKGVTFFSSYDLPKNIGIRVIKNRYEKLQQTIHTLSKTDAIYFIGQSLPEVGFMTESDYLNYLKAVRNFFGPKPEINYVCHRGDLTSKLEKIENQVGMGVLDFDMPIEQKLSTEGPIPRIIAGFNSTALQNTQVLLGEAVSIYSFVINSEDVEMGRKSGNENTYNYLRELQSETFKVIEPNLYL